MEDMLQFWRLKEWLSIYQAAVLACGEDPSNNYVETAHDVQGCMIHGLPYEYGMPSGFNAFSSALIDYVQKDSYLSGITDDDRDVVFKDIRNNGRAPSDININTELKVIDIKRWLNIEGIKPDFFFPELDEEQIITSRTTHQTDLMSIMYKTIDRFYGENYDPNNRDTFTKQEYITGWLKDEFSLLAR